MIAIFTQFNSSFAQSPAEKPNFLWLVSEDNSYIFSRLYHEQGAKMPNIEALAKQGLIFNNAFSNAPVCSTARTTLATGAYAPKLALNYHRRYSESQLPSGLKPIAQILRDAGYYTSNNSKNDFNFVENTADPVWHDSSNSASWRNREAGQAFFHMQTWTTTHEYNLHFPASDVKTKPTKHNPDKIKLPKNFPNTELFRYTYARYLDQHQQLDQQIGKVIEQLKADGELENTFIFYFADHGGVIPGTKGYANELGLHVPLVVRIPKNFKHLLHPDLQNLQNARIDGVVNFVDFAPTLAELAGAPRSKYHDGQAFLTADISLKQLNQRNTSFAYADRFDEKLDMVRSLRVGKYKYVRNFFPFIPDGLHNQYRYQQAAYREWRALFNAGKLTAEQASFFQAKSAEALYDIEADPFESNNLATEPQFAQTVRRLRAQLTEKLKAMPDLSFYPEYYLHQHALSNPAKFANLHKHNISKLIDIANAQLKPWQQAKIELTKALNSSDSIQQYWALIGLSSFNQQAQSIVPQVRKLFTSATNTLVKARALEFLTLANHFQPTENLTKLIATTENTLQALEMLNIAATLHDIAGHTFDIPIRENWQKSSNRQADNHQQRVTQYWTNARIDYLKSRSD
ncbi:sulfatase [Catenovulum agarivorans DS-2]|uniref:Sulfatase n=2 Tax=Catenovulum agarivorans TaxID=1172192 RepID=W7QVG5_9ALTE|nr:sulfatase [Catenovulum agarivorans DS-2]